MQSTINRTQVRLASYPIVYTTTRSRSPSFTTFGKHRENPSHVKETHGMDGRPATAPKTSRVARRSGHDTPRSNEFQRGTAKSGRWGDLERFRKASMSSWLIKELLVKKQTKTTFFRRWFNRFVSCCLLAAWCQRGLCLATSMSRGNGTFGGCATARLAGGGDLYGFSFGFSTDFSMGFLRFSCGFLRFNVVF